MSVPSRDDPSTIEVMAFEPKLIIAEFDAFVVLKEGGSASRGRFKAPVFLSLDKTLDGQTRSPTCLAERAIWKATITPDHSIIEEKTQKLSSLILDIKREIAAGTGIDESKISVEIKIVA